MKKVVFGLLVICLMAGIPLMIMDSNMGSNGVNGKFTIPAGYTKIEIDLDEKSRNSEVIFTSTLDIPKGFDLYVQSDSEEEKIIEVTSEHKFIGKADNKHILNVNKVTDNMANTFNQIFGPGEISISLTNQKAKGKIVIGYRERAIDISEYERLSKIDSGDLNNPPKGYDKAYRIDLSGLKYKDETIYSITLDKAQNVGFSFYTDSREGNVSVDLIGENSSFYGLISSGHNNICDQLELMFEKGEYKVRLNCENADGQLYVFIKK